MSWCCLWSSKQNFKSKWEHILNPCRILSNYHLLSYLHWLYLNMGFFIQEDENGSDRTSHSLVTAGWHRISLYPACNSAPDTIDQQLTRALFSAWASRQFKSIWKEKHIRNMTLTHLSYLMWWSRRNTMIFKWTWWIEEINESEVTKANNMQR